MKESSIIFNCTTKHHTQIKDENYSAPYIKKDLPENLNEQRRIYT